MQLIDNWKDALKMQSVQVGGAIAVLGIAEQLLPSLQAVLPPIAYGALGLLVMIARVIVQKKLSKTANIEISPEVMASTTAQAAACVVDVTVLDGARLATDGCTHVPTDGTWILEKGEKVIRRGM